MAAPKAPSELGQSWPELITAAVLLFVPPPQDGVAFGTLYQVAGIYRLTYIVHLHVPLYGSTIFFPFAREISARLDRVSPPGSFATALPYTCRHFRLLAGFLLPLCPFPSNGSITWNRIVPRWPANPGVYATLRGERRRKLKVRDFYRMRLMRAPCYVKQNATRVINIAGIDITESRR